MVHNATWKRYAVGGLVFLLISTAVAIWMHVWVLTALPVGFLLGFFLQKGDLCGASAMSEVIAFRDGRKLFGVWVCIVVSMLAFAAGDILGLVMLNPKPMLWLILQHYYLGSELQPLF